MPYKNQKDANKNFRQRYRKYYHLVIKNKYKKYPEKRILIGIKQRCNNKNNPKYKNYGYRGIKCLITEEEIRFLMKRDTYWKLKDPTIDRIDNDGNYELNNCRFIERNKNKCISKIFKIKQLNKNKKLIKIWNSITEIEKYFGFSTGNISTGISKNKIRYGCFWEKIYDNSKS